MRSRHSEIVPSQQVFPGTEGCDLRPLYLFGDLPSFSPHVNTGRARVLINTIPKSGTYLYSRLLQALGAINTEVHLSANEYWDFRDVEMARIVASPDDFKAPVPFEQTKPLLRDGQFAVGHVARSEAAESLMEDTVHLFCIRDLRDVLISSMRFVLDPRRSKQPPGDWWREKEPSIRFARYLQGFGGAYFKNRIAAVAEWHESSGPELTLRFETILGDEGPAAQEAMLASICETTGLSPTRDPLAVLNDEVIGSATRTYSGHRSQLAEYESEEVLDLLAQLGVDSLNARLGYGGRGEDVSAL